MQRRTFVRLAAVSFALAASGHTPYKQWAVYRKSHLLILTTKTDESYPLGKQLAEVLLEQLPASKARVARAPHLDRVASLLSSQQMDLALLRPAVAEALLLGDEPFRHYGPIALTALIRCGAYLLVCREDFAKIHGYLVAQTLSSHQTKLMHPVEPPTAADPIPIHPGALAYFHEHPQAISQ